MRLDPFRQGDTFDPDLISWVLDDLDLPGVHEAIKAAVEIVVDLETTGLAEYAWLNGPLNGGFPARIVLASLTLPTSHHMEAEPATFVVPLSHPASPFLGKWRQVWRDIANTILRTGTPINNQNMKFDARWTGAHTGVDLGSLIAWDTQISSHLIDENESTKLKEAAPRSFGIARWDDFDLTTPGAAERVPLFDLGVYAGRDTYWTWRLGVAHRTRMNVGPEADPDFEPQGPDEVEEARMGTLAVWCAMPTVATLSSVEQRGMLLDEDWTRSLLTRLNQQSDEVMTNLVDRYNLDLPPKTLVSFAATSNFFRAWTEAAVKAGDLRIAALTPGGAPQWNKQVLSRQARSGSEVASLLMKHRKSSKAAEFLESWLKHRGPDGRIRTTYHAGRVLTGRLSSSDPNMQQVTEVLKGAFIPRPGYVIAEFDHSQIELRVIAHAAPCIPMLEAFQRKEDLHRILASEIAGIPQSEVTKDQRQSAKPANFGLVFGMQAEGFQDYAENNYGVFYTIEEAMEVHHKFFQLWEGLEEWHARQIATAHRTGRVVSPIGRVRRLPAIHYQNPSAVSHAERQAINSPIQSFASDIMQIGAAAIEGTLPGFDRLEGVDLVGTVHDSIIAEIREDDWRRLCGLAMRRMLDIHPVLERMGCKLTVPLSIEAKVGARWGAGDLAIING